MEKPGGSAPAAARRLSARASRDDIRQQFAFDLRDLVLQYQLALFEPLKLQLIEGSALGKARDNVVEIAVLGF